jgi:hypothetical protein
MTRLLLVVRALAPIVYLLAAFGMFLGIRSFFRARGTLNVARFRLEREQAQEQGGRAITQIIVLVEIVVLVLLLSGTTYRAFDNFNRADEPAGTAEPERLETRIPEDQGAGLEVPTQANDPEFAPIRTPRPSPTAAGTLLPADEPTGCIAEQANIDIPDNGQIITQVESIFGTANIENFGYYRFEIRDMESGGDFGVIGGAASDYSSPVTNGPLGSIVPQNFIEGEYRFRMTVFDASGVMRAACEISIFISEPLPTPTPIGAGVPIPTLPADASPTP